jgi:hypothetical protein
LGEVLYRLRKSANFWAHFKVNKKLCGAMGWLPHIPEIGKIYKPAFARGVGAVIRKIIQYCGSSQAESAPIAVMQR